MGDLIPFRLRKTASEEEQDLFAFEQRCLKVKAYSQRVQQAIERQTLLDNGIVPKIEKRDLEKLRRVK